MNESQPSNYLDDVKAIQAEQKALRDKCAAKRLAMMTDCEYGYDDEDTGNFVTPAEVQAAVKAQCANDIFFFIYYFVCTFDPRMQAKEKVMEMVLYPYQITFIKWLCGHIDACLGTIEKRNLLLEKSRDMGASWLVIIVIIWYWLFHDGSFLFGSRKEEEVDKHGDMDTPFEKARFILRTIAGQAPWLLPEGFDLKTHATYLLLRKPNSEGGQITGESANPEFSRGGRNIMNIFDEMPVWGNDDSAWTAASQSCSIRLGIGTPKGPFGTFANLANPKPGKEAERVHKFRMHWTLHPIKAAGLRKDHEGKPTSPWYEEQKATMTPEAVAAELDINYTGSVKGLVFPDYYDRHQARGLKPVEGLPILRVWDPGLTFCVLFMQIDHYRRALILQEVLFENARIHDVAGRIVEISQTEYQDFEFMDCGDPAGKNRASSAAEDPEYVTLAHDYDIDVDYTFMEEMQSRLRRKTRITAIHNKMREDVYQTKSAGLVIDIEKCPVLDEALLEKYRYKVNKWTKECTEEIDEQHPWEDVVDCLGYGIVYRLGLNTTFDSSSRKAVTGERGNVKWTKGPLNSRGRNKRV